MVGVIRVGRADIAAFAPVLIAVHGVGEGILVAAACAALDVGQIIHRHKHGLPVPDLVDIAVIVAGADAVLGVAVLPVRFPLTGLAAEDADELMAPVVTLPVCRPLVQARFFVRIVDVVAAVDAVFTVTIFLIIGVFDPAAAGITASAFTLGAVAVMVFRADHIFIGRADHIVRILIDLYVIAAILVFAPAACGDPGGFSTAIIAFFAAEL